MSQPSLLALLPFQSRQLPSAGGEADDVLAVAVYQCEANACEQQDDGGCLSHGVYYGTPDALEPKFCPRHFFQMHLGPQATYELVER